MTPQCRLQALLFLSSACFTTFQSGVLLAQDSVTALAQAAHWNQWRGPQRSGQVQGPAWPAKLDGLERTWRVPLGKSYSGPVVDAERVYTTESGTHGEDSKSEHVRAFDRGTGKELWKVDWDGAMKVPFFAARNGSWIRATPALDDRSIYVAGMVDTLTRIDKASGELLWHIDLRKDWKQPEQAFGFVCSPLVVGGHVFVQTGGGLLKIDKEKGERVWTSLEDRGGMMGGAFSSPILAKLNGQEQLLVQTREELCGVDPEHGNKYWGVPIKTFRGMNILTPLPFGDAVFTSSYGGRAQLFDIKAAAAAVDATEGAEAKPVYSSEERWNGRTQGYMTSPVEIGGHAYLYLRSKRFTCVELATGKICWTSEPIGDEYASLVANGDKILALMNSGELHLLAANTERYEVLDTKRVADAETWAHLAVDGEQLFVRELEALSAFTWK